MIRVNLAGTPNKKGGKASSKSKSAGPSSLLPIAHLLILVGTAIGGYLGYSSLSAKSAELEDKIANNEKDQKKLEKDIKDGANLESDKVELERRIKIIEGLKKSQISPVVMLDRLLDSVSRTNYVWLSSFTQSNATISMVGKATTIEALASFYSNLEVTGYFHNINVTRFEDTAKGIVDFTLNCEFAPPSAAKPVEKGAN